MRVLVLRGLDNFHEAVFEMNHIVSSGSKFTDDIGGCRGFAAEQSSPNGGQPAGYGDEENTYDIVDEHHVEHVGHSESHVWRLPLLRAPRTWVENFRIVRASNRRPNHALKWTKFTCSRSLCVLSYWLSRTLIAISSGCVRARSKVSDRTDKCLYLTYNICIALS